MQHSASFQAAAHQNTHWALLLIDVINDFDFPGGKQLLKRALPAAKKIARLKERAREAGLPVIYVNDNFGRWRSDFRRQVEHCQTEDCLGAPIARLLRPDADDYFILKPKHSAFYSTSLDVLLNQLGASRLVLTGFAADICVLFTANDAYMRDYSLYVPKDCLASETDEATVYALNQMKRFLKADTRKSSHLLFTEPDQRRQL